MDLFSMVEEFGDNYLILSTEDVFKDCTELLSCYRGLKKGFETLLLILFSTNIIVLTVMSYYVILGITGRVMFMLIVMSVVRILIPVSLVTYKALLHLMMGYTTFKDMLTILRLYIHSRKGVKKAKFLR